MCTHMHTHTHTQTDKKQLIKVFDKVQYLVHRNYSKRTHARTHTLMDNRDLKQRKIRWGGDFNKMIKTGKGVEG